MPRRPRALDPRYDLTVERVVRATPAAAWAAWTRPEHLQRWYAPVPAVVSECEIELRPGGRFRFVILSPDGSESRIHCCYLEVVAHEQLIWTNALVDDYRPAPNGFFTAEMTLQPEGDITRCTTVAMHRNRDDRDQHAEAGFHEGWGTVLDQLAAYAPTI